MGKFSENYIKTILAKYDEHYKEMMGTICEVVLLSVESIFWQKTADRT